MTIEIRLGQPAEGACIFAHKDRRRGALQQLTDLAQKAGTPFSVAADNLAGPAQGDQKGRAISYLGLWQRFEGCHVLFNQVRLALPEVTTGLGDQQAKRSSANLGVHRIQLLRLLQENGSL